MGLGRVCRENNRYEHTCDSQHVHLPTAHVLRHRADTCTISTLMHSKQQSWFCRPYMECGLENRLKHFSREWKRKGYVRDLVNEHLAYIAEKSSRVSWTKEHCPITTKQQEAITVHNTMLQLILLCLR